jgi:hypothetical protein
MKILETGQQLTSDYIVMCNPDRGGISKCKGCEDDNGLVAEIEAIYEEQE